ncbi:hypothetical protein [Vibrio gazogenes]|uniref:Uncharacterized protein n=1 Tax=Vibrio gazogenes DSM 21264 = NBRC 103151 TaxID=1123492 RepID=A0A1M5EYA4_VIBGA|nr:hypothetical protein [Vibrio gazogenes]USP14771.1 hypothetical protein MKS89_05515 [Vibrio gazogenes]SHF84235.1 hypothetical protein SAMN02745781_03308 [Vibrio gazogenes DSM 21264] [Vibrio gazogenes DSM 21264 = NBRC 103151]SJN55144.1 hypothetical protein BQ6471_01397 [Vibrio gazogenes]
MSIKSRRAVANALTALQADVEQLQRNDERQEKVLDSHAKEIAELQETVKQMRNAAIAAEANNRVPYDEISKRYGGISKGRISQIKKEFSER